MFGPLSPTHEAPELMPSQIRQAKAGRRGDPLSLLREGSSLLPPPSYSMRQYQAPPPWQLAGTGGYRRADQPAPVAAGAGAGAGAEQDAAGGGAYGTAESYRRVLDQQIREKELRRSYEQERSRQEERNEDLVLPSYMNSHRGGGGDAPQAGGGGGGGGEYASPRRNSEPLPERHGFERIDPNAPSYDNNYAQRGPPLEVAVPPPAALGPQHGRRSQGGWGGDGGDHQASPPNGALGRIDEDKSVEQKLYEPSSPQHARFRLAHADPEQQAEMLRKEEERRAMREVLAQQIAEKEERRRVSRQQDQQWDQEEYQRERNQNIAYARAHGENVQEPEQQQQQQQQQQVGGDPYSQQQAPQHWQESNGPSQQQQVQAPAGGGGDGRWHAAPPPPADSNAAGAYQPLSGRGGGGGGVDYQPLNLGLGRTSDSDGAGSALSGLPYAAITGGSAPTWDVAADIFGGAARDSLDDLKKMCKDLLIEQQGLRSQLVNQSNVVNELRSAANRDRGGGGPIRSSRQNTAASRHGGGGYGGGNNPPPTGSSYSSRAAGGPAMGRRSRPSFGRPNNGAGGGGGGGGGGPGGGGGGGGPPSTSASMRSDLGGGGGGSRSGAGSDRRHHDPSGAGAGAGAPAGQWNHGGWQGPPGTGSASARHPQHQQPGGPGGTGGTDGRGGAPQNNGGQYGAEMPWGPVPEPAPELPKSPPIPTHRNKKTNAGGPNGGGAPKPGPPKPGGGPTPPAPSNQPPTEFAPGHKEEGEGGLPLDQEQTRSTPDQVLEQVSPLGNEA